MTNENAVAPAGTLAHRVQSLALIAGPLVAVALYFLLPADLGHAGRATTAVAALMAVWWLTEALPISATALVPLALFPLAGIASIGKTAAPYADKVIFLFMGGFMIGIAMQRWNLHYRFALAVVAIFGTEPKRLVGGFMLATATLSMWISNTATVVMMLPIAVTIIDLVQSRLAAGPMALESATPPGKSAAVAGKNFAICLLLGVAYASSIGGVGTLLGTPPNALLKAFVENHIEGMSISFAGWMALGVPVVVVMLPIAWLLLTRVLYPIHIAEVPGGRELVASERAKLGPISAAECAVMIVFLLAAGLWVFRDLLVALGKENGWVWLSALDDSGIAMLAALSLFIIPARDGQGSRLLDWDYAQARLPWGVLILFGGGLSLASAMSDTGVAQFLGRQFAAMQGIDLLLIIFAVTATVVFLTELTSNTATTSALLPILAAAAVGLGLHPYYLIVSTAIGASMAFMMPVATPPNAIVFSSGKLTIPQMAKAGFWLNWVSILLVTAVAYLFLGALLGVDLTQVPALTATPAGK